MINVYYFSVEDSVWERKIMKITDGNPQSDLECVQDQLIAEFIGWA